MTKLTHQPFSEWLLSAESLAPEEECLLQEHLRSCPECQQQQAAWGQVQRLFQNASPLAPAQGFVSRWQSRLVEQRRLRQRKVAWAWFGLCAGSATLALAFLGYLVLNSLQSPLNFLALWIYRLTVAFSYWSSLEAYLGVFQGLWPGFSWVGLALLTGAISFFSVLWLAAYRRLSMARRVV